MRLTLSVDPAHARVRFFERDLDVLRALSPPLAPAGIPDVPAAAPPPLARGRGVTPGQANRSRPLARSTT